MKVLVCLNDCGTEGERSPSENELAATRFQGRHLAMIAAKLSR